MDDVQHDGHGDATGGRVGTDPVDLVAVAVDQGDPGAGMGRVTPVGLINDLADDGGGPRLGVEVIDRCDGGHPFAVALLTLGEPGGQLWDGVRGGFGGLSPQAVGAHHGALGVSGKHQHVVGVAGRVLRVV